MYVYICIYIYIYVYIILAYTCCSALLIHLLIYSLSTLFVLQHSMLVGYAVLSQLFKENAGQVSMGFGNIAWLTFLDSVRLKI